MTLVYNKLNVTLAPSVSWPNRVFHAVGQEAATVQLDWLSASPFTLLPSPFDTGIPTAGCFPSLAAAFLQAEPVQRSGRTGVSG